jgi:valyl-tRNA synthetase
LKNERFVAGAPEESVAVELKKEADALTNIALLEEKLTSLG